MQFGVMLRQSKTLGWKKHGGPGTPAHLLTKFEQFRASILGLGLWASPRGWVLSSSGSSEKFLKQGKDCCNSTLLLQCFEIIIPICLFKVLSFTIIVFHTFFSVHNNPTRCSRHLIFIEDERRQCRHCHFQIPDKFSCKQKWNEASCSLLPSYYKGYIWYEIPLSKPGISLFRQHWSLPLSETMHRDDSGRKSHQYLSRASQTGSALERSHGLFQKLTRPGGVTPAHRAHGKWHRNQISSLLAHNETHNCHVAWMCQLSFPPHVLTSLAQGFLLQPPWGRQQLWHSCCHPQIEKFGHFLWHVWRAATTDALVNKPGKTLGVRNLNHDSCLKASVNINLVKSRKH